MPGQIGSAHFLGRSRRSIAPGGGDRAAESEPNGLESDSCVAAGTCCAQRGRHGQWRRYLPIEQPRPMGAADRRLRQPALFPARSDQRRQRRQHEGGWSFSTGVLRGHEGSPLVIGSIMFLHTPFPMSSTPSTSTTRTASSGHTSRSRTATSPASGRDTVNRGVAYADGKVFLYQADTTLVALDAKSGKDVWHAVNGDPKKGETGVAAPVRRSRTRCWSASPVRTSASAASLPPTTSTAASASGAPTASAPMRRSCSIPTRRHRSASRSARTRRSKTWTGDQWTIGGGSVWGWFSYDPALNLVYYGTANPRPGIRISAPAPTASPSIRSGPCRSSHAIPTRVLRGLGLSDDAVRRVGLRRHQRDDPRRSRHRRQACKALVHFDRNGFAYTLDRATGELLVAKPYDPDLNWSTGVEMDPSKPNYGRPSVVAAKSTFQNGPDTTTDRHLSGVARRQERAARSLLAANRPLLRADEQPLHGTTSPTR